MFRFRLQRVLELREQREKEKAITMAEAEQKAQLARDAYDELRTIHSESAEKLIAMRSSQGTVGHLQNLTFVLTELENRMTTAAERVSEAEGIVAAARAELDIAARDRRVLDRLREKHHEAYRAEQAQRERIQMDEVALGRFTRSHFNISDGVAEG